MVWAFLHPRPCKKGVGKWIQKQTEKYGWEFLFLGANIDAVATASRYGIGADRAVNYHADGEGTKLNYEVTGDAIMNVAKWQCRIGAFEPNGVARECHAHDGVVELAE